MQVVQIEIPQDLPLVIEVAEKAFSSTPDSSLDQWFSFEEMQTLIKRDNGLCLKAVSETGEIVGIIFAAQESLITGKESEEKWMINLTGVIPEKTGQGIGAELLSEIEKQARQRKIKKGSRVD